MGTDTPLACLSDKPQLLYNYFRQLFAQVTNPPLDAIREELVTSLYTYLGREGNLLDETPKHCHLIKLKQPILQQRRSGKTARSRRRRSALRHAADAVQRRRRRSRAWKSGRRTLRLPPRKAVARRRVDPRPFRPRRRCDNAPIPSLLATAAVHHHLIREGTRTQCGLVIETGEAREAHHFCCSSATGPARSIPISPLKLSPICMTTDSCRRI